MYHRVKLGPSEISLIDIKKKISDKLPTDSKEKLVEYFVSLYRDYSYEYVIESLQRLYKICTGNEKPKYRNYCTFNVSEIAKEVFSFIGKDIPDNEVTNFITDITRTELRVYQVALDLIVYRADYKVLSDSYGIIDIRPASYSRDILITAYRRQGHEGFSRMMKYVMRYGETAGFTCSNILKSHLVNLDSNKGRLVKDPYSESAALYFDVLFELIHFCGRLEGYQTLMNDLSPEHASYVASVLENV